MSWQDELDHILSGLGVSQEGQGERSQQWKQQQETFSLSQAAHDRPGVFYYLDLTVNGPQVRVFVPDSENATHRVRQYLVTPAAGSFFACHFGAFLAFEGGSPAYQEIEGAGVYHQFIAITEMMKALFWQGNREANEFPPEIAVQRVL